MFGTTRKQPSRRFVFCRFQTKTASFLPSACLLSVGSVVILYEKRLVRFVSRISRHIEVLHLSSDGFIYFSGGRRVSNSGVVHGCCSFFLLAVCFLALMLEPITPALRAATQSAWSPPIFKDVMKMAFYCPR